MDIKNLHINGAYKFLENKSQNHPLSSFIVIKKPFISKTVDDDLSGREDERKDYRKKGRMTLKLCF